MISAAAAILALTSLATVQAAAAEWVCRESSGYCAEVNGAYAPDARFFVSEGKEKLLVDLPSLSMSAFISLKSRKVVAVPQSILTREAGDRAVRIAAPIPPEAPAYALSVNGSGSSFKFEDTEVRILKASSCKTTVTPIWTGAPVTDEPTARKCLHLEVKPIAATAGCLKGAYLRNSCEAPVTAMVSIVQHLFSGTLPETSNFLIPPGVEYPLGCAWSSGAMAPTEFSVIAAQLHSKQSMPQAGQRGSAKH